MKVRLVLLFVLGLAAALCASVLVASLRAGRRPVVANGGASEIQVQILTATRPLPAMTIIDADAIATKSVPASQVPDHYLGNAIQVLGKVLATPMVEGQPLTRPCLVTDGAGPQLASVLPKGMRAVSLSLPEWSGLSGLLYPGSLVDVIVTLKIRSRHQGGTEAISKTLLQNIQVLATEDQSVVSADKADTKRNRLRPGKHLQVTLMVNAKEAETLQLAVKHGTVSLAMRNPTDAVPVDMSKSHTLLSRLSDDVLDQLVVPKDEPTLANSTALGGTANEDAALVEHPVRRIGSELFRTWDTILIRGDKVETQSFSPPSGRKRTLASAALKK